MIGNGALAAVARHQMTWRRKTHSGLSMFGFQDLRATLQQNRWGGQYEGGYDEGGYGGYDDGSYQQGYGDQGGYVGRMFAT